MSPSKISGRFHSAKGAVRETIGRTIGWHGLEIRGQAERAAGNIEVNAARTKGYAKATGSRMGGKKDQVLGFATGNGAREGAGNLRRAKGSVMQGVHRNV
ncbi:hypothetical protein FA13DRAFT_1735919 [Coprinellus micaceus]|uniref:CsbD-like domain-containing protein n=1 Tax=Coprinellus micaceus TaxID=71717 RepID=A0A4Y7T329_COPMI|nr:hypothetical protein FA13DRAFT_1735919 [Coprinellus micaceus]